MADSAAIAAAEGMLESLRDNPYAFAPTALPGVAHLALQVIGDLKAELATRPKRRGPVMDESNMVAGQRRCRAREAAAKSSSKQS